MIVFVVGLLWGIIVNELAYYLVNDHAPVSPTSFCPSCTTSFTWYQRIPVVSWLYMRGQCPTCHTELSPLNPFSEALTSLTIGLLYYKVQHPYFFAYAVFFSALLITLRTDLETMLISRLCTVYMIPVALFCSYLRLLPISAFESMMGTICGFVILYSMMHIFVRLTGKQGMGTGDLDLLSCIGAFTGPTGCWISLLIGSTLGSIAGGMLMLFSKATKETRIPFGPFLALGAIIYVLWQQQLMSHILGI